MGLQSTLLPYQRRAVAWMLHRELLAVNRSTHKNQMRERFLNNNNNKNNNNSNSDDNIYREMKSNDESEDISDMVSGGILADEMGLGTIFFFFITERYFHFSLLLNSIL